MATGHFFVHFSKMANQDIKQDTLICQSNSYKHDKMADQFRYSISYSGARHIIYVNLCLTDAARATSSRTCTTAAPP